jgi:uncharacterized membrane protein
MMIIVSIGLIILIWITIGFCYQVSKERKIHFIVALLICILATPFGGFLLMGIFPKRHVLNCMNCGNTKSERSKCGVCGNEIVALDK